MNPDDPLGLLAKSKRVPTSAVDVAQEALRAASQAQQNVAALAGAHNDLARMVAMVTATARGLQKVIRALLLELDAIDPSGAADRKARLEAALLVTPPTATETAIRESP